MKSFKPILKPVRVTKSFYGNFFYEMVIPFSSEQNIALSSPRQNFENLFFFCKKGEKTFQGSNAHYNIVSVLQWRHYE